MYNIQNFFLASKIFCIRMSGGSYSKRPPGHSQQGGTPHEAGKVL